MSEEQVGLNINDLQNMVSIVDVATQRGAFKANELTNVGLTYDKIVKFLDAVQKATAETKAAEEKVAEEATGE